MINSSKIDQKHHHQQTAQLILDACDEFKSLFQAQWFYLWTLTPQNCFVIDIDNQALLIADGLIKIHFYENFKAIYQTQYQQKSNDPLIHFVLNDFVFELDENLQQHNLYTQTKVQLFRQILVEQVFALVDAENIIEKIIYNLDLDTAQQLDQIMVQSGYYHANHLTDYQQNGVAIPLEVELNFKHLSLVNSILGDSFLSVQQLIPIYDQACRSARQWISPELYRILEIQFNDQFTLAKVNERRPEFILLRQHALQQPKLLSLVQWIKRGYWQYQDIFNKQSLTESGARYWDERLTNNFPLFHFKRPVNWLYRQDQIVVDWVVERLDDIQVRIAVTILSWVDTSQIHPHIIVLTLKYFENIVSRLLLHEIYQSSVQQDWFGQYADLHPYQLENTKNKTELLRDKISINVSVLYLDEWLDLFKRLVDQELISVKQVIKRLYQVMQAYMHYLNTLVANVPVELIPYIESDKQQHAHFMQLMKKYTLDVNSFRQLFKFKLHDVVQNQSVFDSFVADYLIDRFQETHPFPKNTTWIALYHQALRWHQKLYFEDTMLKLKKRLHRENWERVIPFEVVYLDQWKFIELNNLMSIIHESVSNKHCLALSYAERITEREYVAFQMISLEDASIHLTLGCYYKFELLHFDQLRWKNNEVAPKEYELSAKKFITDMNDRLKWNYLYQS